MICLDDSFSASLMDSYSGFPVKGGTYTVRNIVPGISPSGGKGEVAVYLREIVNRPNVNNIEPGYNAERFAPVEETEETEECEERTLATMTL